MLYVARNWRNYRNKNICIFSVILFLLIIESSIFFFYFGRRVCASDIRFVVDEGWLNYPVDFFIAAECRMNLITNKLRLNRLNNSVVFVNGGSLKVSRSFRNSIFSYSFSLFSISFSIKKKKKRSISFCMSKNC